MKASGGDSKEAITNRNKFRQVSRVHVRTDIVDFSRNMTTFFPFETRFRSEQEMLMNDKNNEMERWASLVALLSSILFFVCLFVCLLCDASSVWNFYARFSDVISRETCGGVAAPNVVCFLRLIWNQEIQS